MPSSYTTSLRLTLPATGELAGQWGSAVNTGITELLDAAVAGTTTISTWGGAGVSYTLSNNSGTADEARRMFIVATGTPGEAKNVICPAVSKFYVFRNDTTGGFDLTLKTSGGAGIAVPAGQYKFLYCDGTNVVEAFNSAGALTLSGALSVGGTATFAANPTLSAGTANQVQYLNGSKVLVGSANLMFDGTTLTANAINTTTLDLTNIEVTNVKAKDGTSAATIADSTGVVSFTANPVLSAGTANGVVYANGSKVLTSGSALTFDGTTLATTGALTVDGNTTLGNASTDTVQVNGYMGVGGAGTASFGVSVSSSALTNTSQRAFRAGITATSAATTSVIGYSSSLSTAAAAFTVTDMAGFYAFDNVAGAGSTITNNHGLYIANQSAGTNNYGITSLVSSGTNKWNIYASGTAANYFAGNVGIGTTTSFASEKLSVFGSTFNDLAAGNGSANTSYDWLVGASGNTSFPVKIVVDQGASSTTHGMSFYTSNAATPAERMRLDASGNLGLGVTPSAWSLGASGRALQIGAYSAFYENGSGYPEMSFNSYQTGGSTWTYLTSSNPATRFSQTSGAFQFFTAPSGTAGNAISFTQAMTLTSGGDLLVGTTATVGRLTVDSGSAGIYGAFNSSNANGGYLEFRSSGTVYGDIGTAAQVVGGSTSDFGINARGSRNLIFGTNNTERARITSGGNLLVGKTADDATTAGVQVVAGGAITLVRNSASNCVQINKKGNSGDLMAFYYNDATVVGTITNSSTNTAYNTSSDRRLKENIVPAPSASSDIDAIQIVSHDWKSAPGEHVKYGVVAQDLHMVAPQAVSPGDDGTEIERTWGVDYSKLVPMLIKEIQQLRARVAALEA